MRRVRGLFVLMAMTVMFCLVAEDFALADPITDEGRFVEIVNAHRPNVGLAPLTVDAALVASARSHSQRMASSGTIFHNQNLPNEFAGQNWAALGENVGTGGSVETIMDALMNSPAHRANILGDYDRIGVGIVMVGATYYVTQVFWKTSSGPATATVTTRKSCRKVRGRTVCKTVRTRTRRKRSRRRR